MRFIICGTMIHPGVEERLPGASPASGKYLRNLKNALEYLGNEVVYCSYSAVPGVKEAYEELNLDDTNLVYKDRTIITSIIKFQKKLLCMLQKEDVVIFYNLLYFELGLIDKIKKRGNSAVLILADHTDSFRENGGIVRGCLAKIVSLEYRKFDYGVALSEYARRFFKADSKVIVMEGGLDLQKFEGFKQSSASEKIRYMYAGTLNEVTGVDKLLDAIKAWDANNVEFCISGKGSMEDRVKIASKEDQRIKFLGFIPDEEYYDTLQEMGAFINPRNMTLEQNQNNFPSKVLEYLATGRAVISTKFPGWEKFSDAFFFYDGSMTGLIDCLESVRHLDREQLEKLYVSNRKMADNFDWKKQAEKIVELVR